jgi:pyrroline-5-carboxylate reductase
MQKLGFIGCGKMASAIIKGLISSSLVEPENIIASKHSSKNLEEKSEELGIEIILNNRDIVKSCDTIFLATEPSQIKTILEEISNYITEEHLVISIAAGISTQTIESSLNTNARVVRVMPNTPSLLKEGMSGICAGKNATEKDIIKVENIFSSVGKTLVIDESKIDILTAISGSGPAFFYKVINDIARAGENLGLEYDQALLLSIQTAIGAAKMAKNRKQNMEDLIAQVATKGGCTKVGIDTMNENNTAKVFQEVIYKTSEKAKALGN